jgi:hypothetical protein
MVLLSQVIQQIAAVPNQTVTFDGTSYTVTSPQFDPSTGELLGNATVTVQSSDLAWLTTVLTAQAAKVQGQLTAISEFVAANPQS